MGRWLPFRGTDRANVFTYQPAKTPGGGYSFEGGRGVDTLKLLLKASEWAKPAVQKELAALAEFLAEAPRNAKGEIAGTFVLRTLNLRLSGIEKLDLRVAGARVNPLNDAPVLKKYSAREFRALLAGFREVRIVEERFPVKSRLHGGWKGTLFNTFFVGAFNALPRALVRRFGWHLLAFCRK